MATERDPFDLLRANDPVDVASLPDADSATAGGLLARITTQPRSRPRRSWPSRWRRLALVTAVAVITAAAAWAILARDVTEPLGVLCHEEASLESSSVLIRPDLDLDPSLCAAPWEDGVLANPNVASGSVPPLTACVNEHGSLLVFPTSDTSICDRLELAPPTPESADELQPVVQLENELVDYFAATGCAAIADAEAHVRGTLDRLGLTQWTVTTQPPHPDRPCASFGLDTASMTVVLTPIPTPPP